MRTFIVHLVFLVSASSWDGTDFASVYEQTRAAFAWWNQYTPVSAEIRFSNIIVLPQIEEAGREETVRILDGLPKNNGTIFISNREPRGTRNYRAYVHGNYMFVTYVRGSSVTTDRLAHEVGHWLGAEDFLESPCDIMCSGLLVAPNARTLSRIGSPLAGNWTYPEKQGPKD